MKIIITGARGYLSHSIIPVLKNDHELILTSFTADREIWGLPIEPLDLSHGEKLHKFIESHKPDLILNTAAVTLPDWAEDNQDKTYAANVIAVENLIRECQQFSIKLVHISTDYVFSGENPPYSEEDKREPVNFYGKTKLQAEQVIEKSEITYLICRITMLFGIKSSYHRPNPFVDAYNKLKSNQTVFASTTHTTAPSYVENLAECIKYLVEHNVCGIYHTAGSEMVSRFEFAKYVAEIFNFDPNLIVPAKNIPKKAVRPLNSTLNISKLISKTGFKMLNIKEALLHIKQSNSL
jgi:dTDP-4-dehydrorhamnose reductase